MASLNTSVKVLDKLFALGDPVLKSGWYVCIPCGYRQYFQIGDNFTTCEACFAGTDLGPEGFTEEEVDFWEYDFS